MKEQSSACVEPGFFLRHSSGPGPAEARAVLIAQYAEGEVSPEIRQAIETHLKACQKCAALVKEMASSEELVPGGARWAYAVCPSSTAIDTYLFDRTAFPPDEQEKIERHLNDCQLCRRESEWLRDLESTAVVEFEPASKRRLPRLLSMAAVIALLAITAALFFRNATPGVPQDQLRALADVKEPHELNYASLNRTSPALAADVDQLYQQGLQLLQQRKFSEARQRFEAVLARSPAHSGSLFLLGYSYYYTGDLEKAFELCDRAEKMGPHSYERCISLVHIALKSGNFGRAVKEITALYHEAPEVPEVRDLYQRITNLTQGRTIRL